MSAFRRLWLAGLISDTGDWLLFVSLPIVVYERTGSTLGTASAFLIELAPGVLLAPAIGRLADRPDRRRTLVMVSLAQAAALTPLLAAANGLAVLYAVIALQAALAALFEPTKNALLPTLVTRDGLVRANALVGLNQNLGRLVGGSLGGLLLAVAGGLTTIVAVDAVSFLLAAALIAGLPPGAALPAAPARRGRPLRHGLIVLFLASVAQGIFVVLFVVFVARELHGDAAEIGLLRGVQAIGAIGAGLVLSLAVRLAPRRLTTIGALALGLLSLAIWNGPALTTAQPAYVALFIAVGAPGIWLMTGLVSELQEASDEGRRGRAFTVVGVVVAAGQALGMLAGGLLGDPLGVVTVLNVQAILYLAAGWYAAQGTSTSLPVLRRASRSSWARRASSSA